MRFWPRRRRFTERKRWLLSETICQFSNSDRFTLADACEGVQIFGQTGSAKSTGSGTALANGFLAAGMGGLVLTAKPDERRQWENYCRKAGRLDDLIVVSPENAFRYNILDDERRRAGLGGGMTENIVNLITEMAQVADGDQGSGGDNDGYWRQAKQQLIRNSVDALNMANGRLSFPELYRFVISLPHSLTQVADPIWQDSSFAFQKLRAAENAPLTPSQRRDYVLVADYCLFEFPSLAEKTRSIIVSTFTGLIDVFQRGVLRDLFCENTTFTPEMTAEGKILVIDLPVKNYLMVGRLAQVIVKFNFMRSIERRAANDATRPVFLWADESQLFTSDYDFQFQTTARSARVCTVYLTQNLPNYYAVYGGSEDAKAKTDSLLGNLGTKIFHANGDHTTNEWASNLIGRTRQFFLNANRSYSTNTFDALCGWNSSGQSSGGMSETMEYEVQPRVFTTLRKGGKANGGYVDTIVFQGGRCFSATGKSWLPVTFKQSF